MAGSKVRANIQGHTIVGEADTIRELRRLSGVTMRELMVQARDHGQVGVTLSGIAYIVVRQSDHTFLVKPGEHHRIMAGRL